MFLSQTRWIVMTGWCTSISLQPFVQTRLDFLYSNISLHPVFQTRLIVVACLFTSISLHPVFQTRLDCGCLFVYPPAHTKIKVTLELE